MISVSDTFDRYLREIARYPRISRQREGELSRIIQHDSNEEQVEAAVHELVHANLRLVVHCLKDFRSYLSSAGTHISRMDLIAEGNVALLNAARTFNAAYDANDERPAATPIPFSGYACTVIKRAMHRAIKRSRMIHVPEYHYSRWGEMKALREKHGDALTDDVLIRELDVNPAVLEMLRTSESTSTCMLEDLGARAEDGNWESFLPNEQAACPARETDQRDLRRFLLAEMQKLPARTSRMLHLRFLSESRTSLMELAQEFDISPERCRQVCSQGLAALRDQILGQQLEGSYS